MIYRPDLIVERFLAERRASPTPEGGEVTFRATAELVLECVCSCHAMFLGRPGACVHCCPPAQPKGTVGDLSALRDFRELEAQWRAQMLDSLVMAAAARREVLVVDPARRAIARWTMAHPQKSKAFTNEGRLVTEAVVKAYDEGKCDG
jgi:hypothetical protein